MLQYIVKSGEINDVLEQTRIALDVGCKWIELKAPSDVDDKSLEIIIKAMKDIVKRHDATFTIASRVALAKQTEIDGVQLYEGDMSPSAARMELDAGPIIGMSVNDIDIVERNMHFDIDFFRMEPLFEQNSEHLEELVSMSSLLRNNRSDKPLAAAGGINVDNVEGVIAAGAEGIAVDKSISSDIGSLENNIKRLMTVIEKG